MNKIILSIDVVESLRRYANEFTELANKLEKLCGATEEECVTIKDIDLQRSARATEQTPGLKVTSGFQKFVKPLNFKQLVERVVNSWDKDKDFTVKDIMDVLAGDNPDLDKWNFYARVGMHVGNMYFNGRLHRKRIPGERKYVYSKYSL